MSFPLFDKLYGEPNLLIPKGRPVGDVVIDRSHPIGSQVLGYFLFDYDGQYDLTGNGNVINSGGNFVTSMDIELDSHRAWNSPDGGDSSTNRLRLPNTDHWHFTGKKALTVLFRHKDTDSDLTQYGYLFSVRDASNNETVFSLSNTFDGQKFVLQMNGNPGVKSNANIRDKDVWRWYGFRYNGSFVYFYRDDVAWGSGAQTEIFGNVNNIQPVIGNAISDSVLRAIEGDLSHAIFIDGDIGDAAYRDLIYDPYQLLKPTNSGIWIPEIAAVGGVTVPIMSHHYTKNIGAGR